MKDKSVIGVERARARARGRAQKRSVPGLLLQDTGDTLDTKKRQPPTLPLNAVPSAQAGLTSLFGMGRGGTPPP